MPHSAKTGEKLWIFSEKFQQNCSQIFLFIAPAYSKVRYRGSTFRQSVRPSVRPQFMSRCLLCSSDSWEYETLHINYP